MKISEVQSQVEELAKAHIDGIDTVSTGIKDLYMVIDHLSNQMRQADLLIAALKYTIIKKGIATEDSIDSLVDKMAKMANKDLDKEKEAELEKPTASVMQDELKVIHNAAKKAAETPYDPEAFIFGS